LYSYKKVIIVYLLIVSLSIVLTAMQHKETNTSNVGLPKKRLTLDEEINMLIGGSDSPCLDDEPPMSAKDLTDAMRDIRND
jgi:hypothetical protein